MHRPALSGGTDHQSAPPLSSAPAQRKAQVPKTTASRPPPGGNHALITGFAATGYGPIPTKACGSTPPAALSTRTFFADTEQAGASKRNSLGLYPEGYPEGPRDHSTYASGRPASRNLSAPPGPGPDTAAPMKTHTRRQAAAAAADKVRRPGVVQCLPRLPHTRVRDPGLVFPQPCMVCVRWRWP